MYKTKNVDLRFISSSCVKKPSFKLPPPQPFKNVKPILSPRAIQTQVAVGFGPRAVPASSCANPESLSVTEETL